MKTIQQFPHCDSRILHAPEDNCEACNTFPEWQELREVWKINFTGHYDPDKKMCPAEEARGLGSLNKWHGNRIWNETE
jgi:hypothetical protein